MRVVVVAMALLSVLAPQSSSSAQTTNGPPADEYPIIAELYDNPARYAGRSVMIYGLVIEAGPGSTFLLQDVSQHPLRVIVGEKVKAAVGDQLLVFGFFHAEGKEPYFSAKALIPTQVVAGGGCC
jgi:hypothetical protein